eukprot:2080158-Rhodomonas_salina.1
MNRPSPNSRNTLWKLFSYAWHMLITFSSHTGARSMTRRLKGPTAINIAVAPPLPVAVVSPEA